MLEWLLEWLQEQASVHNISMRGMYIYRRHKAIFDNNAENIFS